MSRCVECLENSSAKVESLTVFDMVDCTIVIAEHAFVFGVHPKLIKTACRTDMVSMPIEEAVRTLHLVDSKSQLIEAAREIGISFGDAGDAPES